MKQKILRIIGVVMIVPLVAMIGELILSYKGINSFYPWPNWFRVIAIICGLVGSLILEDTITILSASAKKNILYHLLSIPLFIAGITCLILGVGLFIRFIIHAASSNPNAPVLRADAIQGVFAPLILWFVAAFSFISLEGMRMKKKRFQGGRQNENLSNNPLSVNIDKMQEKDNIEENKKLI